MKYLDNFELKFYEITKIILYVRNGLARLRRNWNHQIDSWHELNRKHFSNNLERSSIAGYFSSADNVYFRVSARISVVPKIVRFAGKFGVVRYRYAALPLCYVYWTHTHVYTKSSSQSARISSVERVLFFFLRSLLRKRSKLLLMVVSPYRCCCRRIRTGFKNTTNRSHAKQTVKDFGGEQTRVLRIVVCARTFRNWWNQAASK